MNRQEAKQLAQTVTGEQIRQMLLNAKETVNDWEAASRPNKGLSLGVAFNIFSKIDWGAYGGNNDRDVLMKTNAIWTFGEYLPDYENPEPKTKPVIKVAHQEPDFSNLDDFKW